MQRRIIVFPQGRGTPSPPSYDPTKDVAFLGKRSRIVVPNQDIILARPGASNVYVPSITPPPSNMYQDVYAYMQTLGANGAGVLIGQHSDYFLQSQAQSPYDVFSGTSPNYFVTNTPNLLPAVLGTNVQGPNNGGSPTQQTQTGLNSFVSVSSTWQNRGGLLQVSAFYNNPSNPNAGGSWVANPALGDAGVDQTHNPFPGILTWSSGIGAIFKAQLDEIIVLLKQLVAATGGRPFIYRQFHEFTLGQGGGQWWWDIGGGSPFCTPAQLAQLYRMCVDYFRSNGLGQYMYFEWCINAGGASFGLQAYPDVPGASHVLGTSYVDLLGTDAYPPSAGDHGNWLTMLSSSPGRPCVYGEAGVITFTNPAQFAGNNFTGLTQIVTNNCPEVGIIVVMSQNWSLSTQNGATQAMSTAPMKNLANLPINLYS